MKRILLTFSILLFCLIYWSCQKNDNIYSIPKFQDPFITPALEYLKGQINDENFDALDLSSIQTIKDSGFTKAISIASENKGNHQFVFIEKTGNEYRGDWVEVENRDSMSTGILTTTSFDNSLKTQVTFLNGKAVKIVKTDHNVSTTTLIKYKKNKSLGFQNAISNQIKMRVQSSEGEDSDAMALPNITVTMVQDYSSVILYSTYWMCPTPSYTYSYTPLPQSPGSSGSNGSYNLNLITGPNAIGNINDYFKCFTNVAGSSNKYEVMVCVDQPAPRTRTAWSVSPSGVQNSSSGANPVNVGHTFLILTEISPTETTTRNVGFYPQNSVNPSSPIDEGQLNNNEQHPYNISLTIDINNSQFFNILNFISQVASSNQNYDLNNYNCTSFSIRASLAGDINLPSTIGTWTGGSGNDPGDLGEDIRSMPLQSNMTRSTTEIDHPNLGNCSY